MYACFYLGVVIWSSEKTTVCLYPFNFRRAMLNPSFPPLLKLPIAVVCFKPVLRDLHICELTLQSKTGWFLASVYACLDHPGCSNTTSLRYQSQEGFSAIHSQSLKLRERSGFTTLCIFACWQNYKWHHFTDSIWQRKWANWTSCTEKTKKVLYHSVIVLGSLYSLNVNNCHCGYPPE